MAAPPDRILVIDDSEDIRSALQVMLGSVYEVELAPDGRAGIEAARRSRPSLVISDLVMPGLSGVEVCRAIRADPGICHTPIIILTAHGELRHKLDGFSSGADDYLQKPFNGRELLARIKALLDNRALQRDLARNNEELERVLAELRATQARLIASERLATALKMAAALAHEINNPLSAIIGCCDLLRPSFDAGNLAAEDLLDRIVEQARRIAEVVRRIQDLREVRFVPYVGRETIVDLGPAAPKPCDPRAPAGPS